MLDRYFITLGAATTGGGKVTSGSRFRTVGAAPIAVAGDTCWCPACRSEGVIVPDGPRLEELVDGRLPALQGDLCACKCMPPPRLVATQNVMCQSVDGDWYAAKLAAAAAAAAHANAAGLTASDADTLPLVLVDPDTFEPIETGSYRLQLPDGLVVDTLDQGSTRPLSAAERAGALAWRLDDAAA